MATKKERDKKQLRYSDAKQVAQKQKSNFDLNTLSLPKGVGLFQFKEEKVYKIDVIPFEAKAGNPMVDEGFLHYERTYYIHANIGPENKKFVCLSKTFGEPCPICNHVGKLQKSGADYETVVAYKPKKRQLYAFRDVDNLAAGIQVYEGPYANGFGEVLDAKLDAAEEDDPYRNFFHLDGGRRLKVNCKKDSFKTKDGTGSFIKPVNIEMVERKALSDDLLDQVPCLDDLPKKVSFKELEKLFLEGESGETEEPKDEDEPKASKKPKPEETDENELDDDDEPDEKPTARKPAKPVDDDEDESDDEPEEKPAKRPKKSPVADAGIDVGDIVYYKGDPTDYEVIRISSDGTTITIENDNGKSIKGVEPEDVSKNAPKKGGSNGKAETKKPKPPVDDDDELDDDTDSDNTDDDDEKPEKSSDDSDDDLSEDENEDDEEPAPRKGRK